MKLNKLPYLLFAAVILLVNSQVACKKNSVADKPAAPGITTTTPYSITTTSAISGGSTNSNGGDSITERGICYGTSPNPTTQNIKISSGSGDGTFICTLTGLLINTSYYIRAYAINSNGTAYGNEVSFQTLLPAVDPDPAGLVFVSGGYTNKFIALNAQDGSLKWSVNMPGFVTSSPAYSNGRVFVGCADNKIYAFDTLGVPKWSAPVQGLTDNSPIIGNNLLYISGSDGVTAFDPANGSVAWSFLSPGSSTLLIFKNNTVYYNAFDSLYALDATTGIKKWGYYANGHSSIPPVVFNDRIYVISYPHTISAINTATGTQIWKRPDYSLTADDIEGMNVKNGNIYVITDDLIILDSANGTFKSSTGNQINIYSGYIQFSDGIRPIIVDSLVFVPGGTIYVRDAYTGAEKFGLGGTVAGPTIIGDIMYFTHREIQFYLPDLSSYYAGLVTAYNYKTRTIKWEKQFVNFDFIRASPCVVTRSGKGYRGGVSNN